MIEDIKRTLKTFSFFGIFDWNTVGFVNISQPLIPSDYRERTAAHLVYGGGQELVQEEGGQADHTDTQPDDRDGHLGAPLTPGQ